MIKLEDQPIEKQIKNNRPKKADIVFNKLMVQQKRPKNPFDKIREYTPHSLKEIKSQENVDDSL